MIATKRTPAAYIGPTQYRQMLWGILLGYLTFGDGVDVPMITGMAFIIASGLLPLRQKNKGIIFRARPTLVLESYTSTIKLLPKNKTDQFGLLIGLNVMKTGQRSWRDYDASAFFSFTIVR